MDIGTSAVKALLLDEHGDIRAKGRSEVPSADGEQEPEDWWSATIEELSRCGPDVKRVRLLGRCHSVVATEGVVGGASAVVV